MCPWQPLSVLVSVSFSTSSLSEERRKICSAFIQGQKASFWYVLVGGVQSLPVNVEAPKGTLPQLLASTCRLLFSPLGHTIEKFDVLSFFANSSTTEHTTSKGRYSLVPNVTHVWLIWHMWFNKPMQSQKRYQSVLLGSIQSQDRVCV